jgi:hypothetical protein
MSRDGRPVTPLFSSVALDSGSRHHRRPIGQGAHESVPCIQEHLCRPGSRSRRRAAAGARVRDHDGEPRLRADRGNPQAPFINSLMAKANLATNYFAIAHPSNDQLSRGGRRLELQQAVGSVSRLAQHQLHSEHRAGAADQHRQPQFRRVLPDFRQERHRCRDSRCWTTPPTRPPPRRSPTSTARLSIAAGTKIDGISIADQLVAGRQVLEVLPGGPAHHRRGRRQRERRLLQHRRQQRRGRRT